MCLMWAAYTLLKCLWARRCRTTNNPPKCFKGGAVISSNITVNVTSLWFKRRSAAHSALGFQHRGQRPYASISASCETTCYLKASICNWTPESSKQSQDQRLPDTIERVLGIKLLLNPRVKFTRKAEGCLNAPKRLVHTLSRWINSTAHL